MSSSETKKKCLQYSISLFVGEWKLNLITKGSSSKVLELRTAACEHASIGRPTRPYLHQFCVDTRYSLANLPRAMDDRDRWRE